VERPFGPTFKTGPGSDTSQPPWKVTKFAKGFNNHAFEGEGDIFPWKKKQGNTFPSKPWSSNKNCEGLIPMHEGDIFTGGSIRINRRFGSSRLNLACAGLLLEIRDEAARRSPMKLHLAHLTFAYTVTINASAHFVGRSSFALWRSPG
jgi:hypothetical protein